jgi:hypothetical protein
MNWNFSSAISFSAFLLGASAVAFPHVTAEHSTAQTANAQTKSVRPTRPLVYSTPFKSFVAKLKLDAPKPQEIHGKIAFTLTAANFDDTVAGILVYWFPEETRKKIAQITGKPLGSIPTSLVKKDIVAGFHSGTACPRVGIDIGATELDVAGMKLDLSPIVVDVIETQDEVPQLFCAWTRQINAKRQRRGIIASLNRVITGEE